MVRIGLLSDTHNDLPKGIENYFAECDEIWHAGDIGTIKITEALEKIKPVKAVYGNIDGTEIRKVYPKDLRFKCEDVDIFITHIAGTPGKYSPDVREVLEHNPPKLFICGHSHILKVMYDKKYQMLYMNPGAAGKYGFHKVRTLLRFTIDKEQIKDLEVIELKK